MTDLTTAYPLRFHERSCATCRYYREHETVGAVSACLLHGYTLGSTEVHARGWLTTWARTRVCDLWSRRPKGWMIFSKGPGKDPHWFDPYLPRGLNHRRRNRLIRKAQGA